MGNRIVINLETYGDFDMTATAAILIAPESMDKSEVATIVSSVETEFANSNDHQKAVKRLKEQGFETLKYFDCTIGGNL